MSDITRIYMKPKEILALARELRQAKKTYASGTYSLYEYSTRTKYVSCDDVTEWADLDGVMGRFTPSEIARIELAREFPDLKRVGWHRKQVALFDWRAPNALVRPYDGYGVHIDLTAAYWQMYRRLWLDVGFPSGYGTLDLRPVAQRLERNKRARNALVGLTAARKTHMVVKGQSKEVYQKNPFLSPCLWASIMAQLNEIAVMALSLGAIWVGTDGYIFPSDTQNSDVFFMDELDRMGYNYRFQYGSIHIRGWGSYSSPMKTTHMYQVGQFGSPDPFRSIMVLDPKISTRAILTYFVNSEVHRNAKRYRVTLAGFVNNAHNKRADKTGKSDENWTQASFIQSPTTP